MGKNGGTCKDGVNSYTCTCAAGYSGSTCETKDLSYVKTAGRAISGDGSSGICSERLYYGSSGIKACEDKCDQCGDDCKGFVDNYQSEDPYCVFKSTTNIYEKETKDWYA